MGLFSKKGTPTLAIAEETVPRQTRVAQEFFCNTCKKFFLANLNMALNKKVLVVCPGCGRKHQRGIKDGSIVENYHGDDNAEEIVCLKVTLRDKPYTQVMADGIEASSEKRVRRGIALQEAWTNVAAREQGHL